MDKPFSLYLDVVRFTAAVLVVLSHFVQHGLLGGVDSHPMLLFGREAVIVFFVLSGFVIAYSSAEGRLSLRQYVLARSARIYSVVLPLVAACFLLASVAVAWYGADVNNAYQLKKLHIYAPLHLLFMGELWNLAETPPWLMQYWSLGYEVWYYVLFAIGFYLRGARRLVWGGVALLVMGPKLWLLLPVWLAGVALYACGTPWPLGRWPARVGWLATIALLLAYKHAGADLYLRELGTSLWAFPFIKLGSADRYLADYVVCILVYLHFMFARQAALCALEALARPIRALAA
ncbi:MAG: acyltransferase, partial [Bdellovibrionales bacterium]|nr:acyltransferase [Massilia sp.]